MTLWTSVKSSGDRNTGRSKGTIWHCFLNISTPLTHWALRWTLTTTEQRDKLGDGVCLEMYRGETTAQQPSTATVSGFGHLRRPKTFVLFYGNISVLTPLSSAAGTIPLVSIIWSPYHQRADTSYLSSTYCCLECPCLSWAIFCVTISKKKNNIYIYPNSFYQWKQTALLIPVLRPFWSVWNT